MCIGIFLKRQPLCAFFRSYGRRTRFTVDRTTRINQPKSNNKYTRTGDLSTVCRGLLWEGGSVAAL